MLYVSRRLNPTCRHHQGDMRTLRLGETFDAVLVHDAIDYMTSEKDLAAAVATAVAHLHTGGIVVIMPDDTTETFEPGEDIGGTDALDGRGIRFLEWTSDPRPR
jgi:dTDP-4-dehydrorhamnose reductase